MAQVITIQNPIVEGVKQPILTSLDQPWGGFNDTEETIIPYEEVGCTTPVPPGREWGLTHDEVERFAKSQLGEKIGSFYQDAGILYGFANNADRDAWIAEPDPALVMCQTNLPGGDTPTDALAIYGIDSTQYYAKGAPTVTLKFKVRNIVDGEPSEDINVTLLNSQGGSVYYESRPTPDAEGVYTITFDGSSLRNVANTSELFTLRVDRAGEERYTTRQLTMYCVDMNLVLAPTYNFAAVNPASITHIATYDMPIGMSISLVVDIYNMSGQKVATRTTPLSRDGSNQPYTTQLSWAGETFARSGVYRSVAYLDLGNGLVQSTAVITPLMRVTAADSSVVALVAIEPVVNATLYETVTPRFAVYNRGAEKSDVRIIFNGGTPTLLNVYTDRVCTEYSMVAEQETNVLRITAEIDGQAVAFAEYTFTAGGEFNWTVEPGYEEYLTGRGRSNAELPTPADWGGITDFYGVSWKDGGSGWQNGALHLTGEGKAVINITPFYSATQYDAERRIGGGILDTGRTLQIRYRIPSVGNTNQRLIHCWDEVNKVGFYITSDTIYVRMGAAVITTDASTPQSDRNDRHFVPGEYIDLTITVQPYWDESFNLTKHLATMYVNGEFAGEAAIPVNTLSQATPVPITLEGNGSVLDAQVVCRYNKCLDSFTVFKNAVMAIGELAQMQYAYTKNKCYKGNGEVGFNEAFQYCKWLSAQVGDQVDGTCNIIVNTYEFDPNETSTSFVAPGKQELELFFFKNGEVDTERSIKYVANKDGALRVRIQGTSTAFEFRKNERYDGRGKDNNDLRLYVFHWSRAAYEAAGSQNPSDGWVGWDSTTGTWSKTDGTSDLEVKKLTIYLRGNSETEIACELLTTKTNYNESTALRNLPEARWIEDAMKFLANQRDGGGNLLFPTMLTPPQRSNSKVRQAIDGVPAIQFTHSIGQNDYYFSGKVDLITDKKNAGVFGFAKNGPNDTDEPVAHPDYSIEFRNGDTDVCNFRCPYLVTAGKYLDASFRQEGADCLEYRWPDLDTGDTYYGDNYLRENSALQRLFDFVFNCHPDFIGYKSKNGLITSTLTTDITILGERVLDTAANRLAKFKAEMGNYLVKDNVTFQAFVTKVKLWMDQRAKNQFFTHYEGDEIVSTYTDDLNVEGQTYEVLRLLPYDIDSSKREDNASRLRFDFTRLYTDANVYNDVATKPQIMRARLTELGFDNVEQFISQRVDGKKSALYELLDATCQEEYAQFFTLLAPQYLNLDAERKYSVSDEAEAYNSVIYNADTAYKYQASGKEGDHIKAHGSAKEDLLWWAAGRYYFMGGENRAGDFLGTSLYFNLAMDAALDETNLAMRYPGGTAAGIPLRIKSKYRNYISSAVGSTASQSLVYAADPTQYYDITLGVSGVASDDGARTRIHGQKFFEDIADLSKLYIAAMNSWGDATGLKTLKFGDDAEGFENPVLRSIHAQSDPIFPDCEVIDMRNCTAFADGDFTWAPSLKTLLLDGCAALTEINLPETECLQVLHLPANITTLVLQDKPYLTQLVLGGAAGMTVVRLQNIPNAVSLSIAQQIFAAQENDMVLEELDIQNVNWTNVSADMMIWLAGVEQLSLTGHITLSSLTMEQYERLLALYGQEVFTVGNDLIIDYAAPLISGPTLLKNGDTGQFTGAAFPVSQNPLLFILFNGAQEEVTPQTDGQGRVYRTWNGVTLYEASGVVEVDANITQGSSVVVKSKCGTAYSASLTLTTGIHTYPATVTINGTAKIATDGNFDYARVFDTDDFDAAIESSVWELSETQIATLTPNSDGSAAVLSVNGSSLTPVELTITLTVNLTGGRVRTATKTVTVKQLPVGAVDMDLPSGLLWAQGNIVKDAQGNYSMGNPSDYGCYFSWGNIDGHNEYSEDNYSFDDANYNASPGKQLTGSIASNDAEHDAAVARLGNGWHMPSSANFQELFNSNNCTWSWTTVNGHVGYLVTSKRNGNTLFFPACGSRDGSALSNRGSSGNYWSRSFGNATSAFNLNFNSGSVIPANNVNRRRGLTIRPVQ